MFAYRFTIVVLVIVATFTDYLTRINVNIAMVAMVENHTDVSKATFCSG